MRKKKLFISFNFYQRRNRYEMEIFFRKDKASIEIKILKKKKKYEKI